MKPLVYVESSVVSYLTARVSDDPVKSAWQLVTTQWWQTKMHACQAVISPYVIEEVSAGNPVAAKLRIDAIRGLCDARGYRLPELVSPLEMMEN